MLCILNRPDMWHLKRMQLRKLLLASEKNIDSLTARMMHSHASICKSVHHLIQPSAIFSRVYSDMHSQLALGTKASRHAHYAASAVTREVVNVHGDIICLLNNRHAFRFIIYSLSDCRPSSLHMP